MADDTDFLDTLWPHLVAAMDGTGVMGRLAYAVVNAKDVDDEFCKLAKAYITGCPNEHAARRLRVTQMAAAFNVDRKALATYLRAKGSIGPRD